jgi:DnaA-homolog protein
MKQLVLDIGLETGPSLANFFAGSNEAALRHLQVWAASPTRSPVPIYLWGEGASGKSHLLKAAAEALRVHGETVGWMDSDTLNPPDYDEAWRLVLLDDVQRYTAEQQHMAFNWFVNAQSHQCSVMAAGEFAPVNLKLREDLRTRLGWGHVFHLQVLTEPERRAVLRQEADARGVFLSDEVMDFMLTRFSRDLGSLMQLLEQLDQYALQSQRHVTVPLIKAMMETL